MFSIGPKNDDGSCPIFTKMYGLIPAAHIYKTKDGRIVLDTIQDSVEFSLIEMQQIVKEMERMESLPPIETVPNYGCQWD
jgi:hypothetical protein